MSQSALAEAGREFGCLPFLDLNGRKGPEKYRSGRRPLSLAADHVLLLERILLGRLVSQDLPSPLMGDFK